MPTEPACHKPQTYNIHHIHMGAQEERDANEQ